MIRRCDVCGTESELEGVFFTTARALAGKSKTYCPACWEDRWRQEGHSSFRRLFYAAGLGLLAALFLPSIFAGWMLLNFVLFEASVLLATLPHELGHAVAARALGARVFRIVIGFGRLLWIGKFLGFEVELRSIPIGGSTQTGFRDARFFRLRNALVIASGPLVNAGAIAAVLAFVPSEVIWSPSPFRDLTPWAAFVVANALILLVNLTPIRRRTTAGDLETDGWSLLASPFLDQAAIDAALAVRFVREGLEARRHARHEDALRWYEEGLARFPGHVELRLGRVGALIDLTRYEEAREELVSLVETGAIDLQTKTIISNNLAWADVMSRRQDLLEEADKHSEDAFKQAGWFPEVQSTRGAVLIEKGRLDEGIELLEKALPQTEEVQDRAAIAGYLALAEKRRGNTDAAQRYAKTAIALHRGHRSTERLLAEVDPQNELGSSSGEPPPST